MQAVAVIPLVAPWLGVLRWADGCALLVLLAFTWWGARKGALRQALTLALLGGAFWLAGRFSTSVEPTVAKVFALDPDERLAVAWTTVLCGVLLIGGILLRWLGHRLPQRSRGGADRLLGGLLGAAKGAVVLTVVGYVVLAFGSVPAGPALSRPSAPAAPRPYARDLSERVRGSLSAVCLEEWGGLLRRWTWVPAWVGRRVDEVNRRIGAGGVAEEPAARRPRAD